MFTIRPDSVLLGSLPDSVMQVFAYGPQSYAPNVTLPGSRVLAFGGYACDDPQTLWGDIAPILADGTLQPAMDEDFSLAGSARGTRPRYADVLAAVGQKRARHPISALEGAGGVALVRVRDFGPSGISLDSLGWVAGERAVLPSSVKFAVIPGCDGLAVGDTLLLPIPRGHTGAPLIANWCPGRLVVRGGRVPALSVALDRLGDVLVSMPAGLHVINDRRSR